MAGPEEETKFLPRRREALTVDRALQTLGGIVLLLCSGLTAWTLARTVDHEGRLIRVETQNSDLKESLREIKDTLRELREDLKRKP